MASLEILWLLLPIAAGAGWLAGRFHSTRGHGARMHGARMHGARKHTTSGHDAGWQDAISFHRSLKALLADADHPPPGLFADSADTDRNTLDTQLAVGTLFRRRGDVDKAIRLHESLLEHTAGDALSNAQVTLELARDYDTAGLADRADSLLRPLSTGDVLAVEATEALLALQERDRDWKGAIGTARRLGGLCGSSQQALIAHYHCELAEEARAAGRLHEARDWLESALAECRQCARANLLSANLAMGENNFAEALTRFDAVARQRPELTPEIIDQQVLALKSQGDPTALRLFVDRIRAQKNAYSVIRTIRTLLVELDGEEVADQFFKHQILQRPSLKALRDWTGDQISVARPAERDKVEIIFTMLDKVVSDKPAYQCKRCGFRGNELHWRCPSCERWDTVHTIIGAEGE